MSFLSNSIEKKIAQVLGTIIHEKYSLSDIEIQLDYPQNIEHGHLSANIAMRLAKNLGQAPRVIAAEIQELIKDVEGIKKVEIAGAGFINFFLDDQLLINELQKIDKNSSRNIINDPKLIITDISHPNAAKPMGTHHLLSTIIGDSINNLLIQVGHQVVRDSYWGDWGTQFGKLIYAYKNWGNIEQIQRDPINELLKLYVHFHEQAEEDPNLNLLAQEEFKKLEDEDPDNRKIWQWVVDLSKGEFFKLYERLNINFDTYYGESFYIGLIPEIIKEGINQQIFVEGEGGALVVKFDDPNIPICPIVKSDGATLYHTRDLARIKYWQQEKKPQEMVYVVDVAQKLHFTQLFKMSKKFSWGQGVDLKHVHFGRMRFKNKEMSTRKGNIILLVDVLDEAEKRARKLIEEKKSRLSTDEKTALSIIMGIGAVKYSILMQHRITDIVFDWDKMLSFEGNAAPYLQYTFARSRSILRKATEKNITYKEVENIIELSVIEQELIMLLHRYPDVLLQATAEYSPHLITNYLFQLAQKFNSFYNSNPILNGEESLISLRLFIVDKVGLVVKDAMGILGIDVPERM